MRIHVTANNGEVVIYKNKKHKYVLRLVNIGVVCGFVAWLLLPLIDKYVSTKDLSILIVILLLATFAVLYASVVFTRMHYDKNIQLLCVSEGIFVNSFFVGLVSEVTLVLKKVPTRLGNSYYNVYINSESTQIALAYHLSISECYGLANSIQASTCIPYYEKEVFWD